MEKGWPGLPYRPISQFYVSRFGSKVYKIPVSIADDCPNRAGLKGMKACSFCDVWGSAAREEALHLPLERQIEEYRSLIGKKFKADKFLVYFQAFTTTFNKLQTLREAMEVADRYEDVVGFVIGTRPDCISKGVLDLWQEFHQRKFVAVELGVQTFSERHLLFLQRGHTAEASLKAIERIHRETDVDLGIHLIFGLPGETPEEARRTAEICNGLPITNVKLHNLHVLKNTDLARWYEQKLFEPFDFDSYARLVQAFLENLAPHIYVHRLAAYASRWDELIAPVWTSDKMRTHQGLIDFLRAQGSFQSRLYPTSPASNIGNLRS